VVSVSCAAPSAIDAYALRITSRTCRACSRGEDRGFAPEQAGDEVPRSGRDGIELVVRNLDAVLPLAGAVRIVGVVAVDC
jgi:hypothetical protein